MGGGSDRPRGYNQRLLTDPETNVLLGTSYMRLILEGLDAHPVLASAGYNAGPGRARRWRDAAPLEGAIYTETIRSTRPATTSRRCSPTR